MKRLVKVKVSVPDPGFLEEQAALNQGPGGPLRTLELPPVLLLLCLRTHTHTVHSHPRVITRMCVFILWLMTIDVCVCVSRQVTLKGENTSQVVHDDQVKGLLRVRPLSSCVVCRRGDGQADRLCARVQVGSTVEVKTNEGLSSEAIISKLTDASLYTVGERPPLGHMTPRVRRGTGSERVCVCFQCLMTETRRRCVERPCV